MLQIVILKHPTSRTNMKEIFCFHKSWSQSLCTKEKNQFSSKMEVKGTCLESQEKKDWVSLITKNLLKAMIKWWRVELMCSREFLAWGVLKLTQIEWFITLNFNQLGLVRSLMKATHRKVQTRVELLTTSTIKWPNSHLR